MILRRRPLLIALPLAALAVAALAADAPQAGSGGGGVSALKNHNSNAPVDVASDRIELQDRADRALLTGNVKIVQGDMTLTSARAIVAYTRTPAGGTEIQRLDASGNVLVTSPSETARGQFAIYDLNKRLITMLGAVTLTRENNQVNGTRLVIDMNTGRATVDGNGMGSGTTSSSGGRVTGHFTVPKRNNANNNSGTTTSTPASNSSTTAP